MNDLQIVKQRVKQLHQELDKHIHDEDSIFFRGKQKAYLHVLNVIKKIESGKAQEMLDEIQEGVRIDNSFWDSMSL
jgi:iron-sulfur cluster repair protein YtfE (RIC family)